MEILVAIGLLISAANFWLSQSAPEQCLIQVEGAQSWQPCTKAELKQLQGRADRTPE